MMRTIYWMSGLLICLQFGSQCGVAATVELAVEKDTSIFSTNQNNTAGGNDVIYVGKNNGGATRRALLQFDVASSGIPLGSTIDAVTVTLHLDDWTGTAFGADRVVSAYRLISPWGDGTTGSGGSSGGSGQGTLATANGDVTWTYRSWSTSDPTPPLLSWATPGGHFAGGASAATLISASSNPTPGSIYSWSGAGLVADVQSWLDGSTPNHGWLLRDAEGVNGSLLQFYSKEFANAAFRPTLTISYTAVPEPQTWALTALCLAAISTRSSRVLR